LDPAAVASPSTAKATDNARRAIAISREAELFKAVRTGGRQASTSHGAATDVGPLSGLSERFDQLAGPAVVRSSDATERLSAALSRLQAVQGGEADVTAANDSPAIVSPAADRRPAGLARAPRLWIAPALRTLAGQDPSAAGRWIEGLLCELHRVAPATRLDLSLPDAGATLADAGHDKTSIRNAKRVRHRSTGRLRVRASHSRLAEAVFLDRNLWLSSRAGVEALRGVAALPLDPDQLVASGLSIDPVAFWRLAAIATPTAAVSQRWVVCHRSPVAIGGMAAITLIPGRPISVSETVVAEPDATLISAASSVLPWALGLPAEPGAEVGEDGSRDALDALRAQIAGLAATTSRLFGLNGGNG